MIPISWKMDLVVGSIISTLTPAVPMSCLVLSFPSPALKSDQEIRRKYYQDIRWEFNRCNRKSACHTKTWWWLLYGGYKIWINSKLFTGLFKPFWIRFKSVEVPHKDFWTDKNEAQFRKMMKRKILVWVTWCHIWVPAVAHLGSYYPYHMGYMRRFLSYKSIIVRDQCWGMDPTIVFWSSINLGSKIKCWLGCTSRCR